MRCWRVELNPLNPFELASHTSLTLSLMSSLYPLSIDTTTLYLTPSLTLYLAFSSFIFLHNHHVLLRRHIMWYYYRYHYGSGSYSGSYSGSVYTHT